MADIPGQAPDHILHNYLLAAQAANVPAVMASALERWREHARVAYETHTDSQPPGRYAPSEVVPERYAHQAEESFEREVTVTGRFETPPPPPHQLHPIRESAFTEDELREAQYIYDVRSELEYIFGRRNTPENLFAEDQG